MGFLRVAASSNYGVEMYPPGVIFLLISVSCFTWAILRYDLLHPFSIGASIAHEMRSPLASIRLYSEEIAKNLPALCEGYKSAVATGSHSGSISPQSLERLTAIPQKIRSLVRQTNVNVDIFLAITYSGP